MAKLDAHAGGCTASRTSTVAGAVMLRAVSSRQKAYRRNDDASEPEPEKKSEKKPQDWPLPYPDQNPDTYAFSAVSELSNDWQRVECLVERETPMWSLVQCWKKGKRCFRAELNSDEHNELAALPGLHLEKESRAMEPRGKIHKGNSTLRPYPYSDFGLDKRWAGARARHVILLAYSAFRSSSCRSPPVLLDAAHIVNVYESSDSNGQPDDSVKVSLQPDTPPCPPMMIATNRDIQFKYQQYFVSLSLEFICPNTDVSGM
jgi:hypothetical protein